MNNMKAKFKFFHEKFVLIFLLSLLISINLLATPSIQTTFTVNANNVTVKMKSDGAISGTFSLFIADFRYLGSYNPTFTVKNSNFSPVQIGDNISDPNDASYRIQRFSFANGTYTTTLTAGVGVDVLTFSITGSTGTGIIGLSMDDPNYVSNPSYTFNVTQDYTNWADPFYDDGYLTNSDFTANGGTETWWWRTHSVNLGKSWLSTAATTDWNTGSNWSDAAIPVGSEAVTIFPGVNQPIAGSGSVCNHLSALTGANVQVAYNGSLTVNGNLTVADDNGLVVKSTAAGSGSLIVNGTVPTGNKVKVERYIAAANWASGTDGWHFLSSPVASQSISGTFTPPSGGSNDYDFYAWSEPAQMWLNQKTPANGITTFQVGQGYLVAYQQADTKNFIGQLNNADKSVTLTSSGSGALTHYGWNLLGNPYPCALTWATGWTLTNIDAVAQIWNNSAKDYSLLNAGSVVPATNGFMVYTSVASQSLTIPAAARTHSATAWYKSGEQQIRLIAHDPQGESFKEAVIRFNPAATSGFDLAYDAYMLSGFAPKFYSTADGSRFSQNTLPAINSDLVIPFGFEKNESTNFSIELAESVSGFPVYLLDHKTNTVVNLTDVTNYAFTAQDGDDANRFDVFFKLGVGMNELNPLSAVNVYSLDHKIIVANVKGKTQMDVLNVQGQLLNNYELVSNGQHEIPANYPAGIYMVRLSNGGEVKTMKVFVK